MGVIAQIDNYYEAAGLMSRIEAWSKAYPHATLDQTPRLGGHVDGTAAKRLRASQSVSSHPSLTANGEAPSE